MTAFRTITARYPGSCCKRCGGPIAVGARIRYGGRGRTYHLAAECAAAQADHDGHGDALPTRQARIVDAGWDGYAREEGHYDLPDWA